MNSETAADKRSPELRAAHRRLIYLWTCASEMENYVKNDWMDIQAQLDTDEDIPAAMLAADLLFERCQSPDWPSRLD